MAETLRAEYLTIARRSALGHDLPAFKARVLGHLVAAGVAPSPEACVRAARAVKLICPACTWETRAACTRCQGRRWVDDRDAARVAGAWLASAAAPASPAVAAKPAPAAVAAPTPARAVATTIPPAAPATAEREPGEDDDGEGDGEGEAPMVPVARVTVKRGEGPVALVNAPATVHTGPDALILAEATLASWRATVRPGPGYDKCDVTIEWADGERYQDRYDLYAHGHGPRAVDLRGDVWRAVGIAAGTWVRPGADPVAWAAMRREAFGITPEREREARAFLATHAL